MLKTVSLSLEVLKMFTKEKPTWGGRELAIALNENHSKVYRILETLKNHNFLVKDPNEKRYSLGFAVWELGNTLTENLNMRDMIHPVLERVSDATNESAFLTVLDGEEALTFDAVEARNTIRYSVSIGSRTPLYTGASYRSILAFKSQEFINSYLEKIEFTRYTEKTMMNEEEVLEDLRLIRERGYSISEGEYTKDVIAVAVPIFHKETVIGSLTVSGPSYRITDERIEVFVTELLKGKAELDNVFLRYGLRF